MMNISPEAVKRARAALTACQEEYRQLRREQAEKARRELPQSGELAARIRHVFNTALSGAFNGGEDIDTAASESLKLQTELADLLVSHGFEPDALFDRPYCPECGDTGYKGREMCKCLRVFMEESGVAGSDASFVNFDIGLFSPSPDPDWGLSQRENMEGNREFCRSWAERFGAGVPDLFMNGGTGQGKTYLCACIAKLVASRGFSVCYTTAIRLVEEMEARRFERDRENTDTRRFYEAELLIIDDLGTEMVNAFVQSALYDVINTRLSAGLKTIINANLKSHELTERYIPQICSRLLGEYRTLHFFGPDLRMTMKKKNTKRFGI